MVVEGGVIGIESDKHPFRGSGFRGQAGSAAMATSPNGSKPAEQRKEPATPSARRVFRPTGLIPGLGFFRCQVLLEFLNFRGNHHLAVSLGWILGEIVLVIVFCCEEMF